MSAVVGGEQRDSLSAIYCLGPRCLKTRGEKTLYQCKGGCTTLVCTCLLANAVLSKRVALPLVHRTTVGSTDLVLGRLSILAGRVARAGQET